MVGRPDLDLSVTEHTRIIDTLDALRRRCPAEWVVLLDTGSNPRSNHHLQAVITATGSPVALMIARENIGSPDEPEYDYYWELARFHEGESDWLGVGPFVNENSLYEQDLSRVIERFAAEVG